MTIELYLLIGVTFTLFMEHFFGDTLRDESIPKFIMLLFFSVIWPIMLTTVLIMEIMDWIKYK